MKSLSKMSRELREHKVTLNFDASQVAALLALIFTTKMAVKGQKDRKAKLLNEHVTEIEDIVIRGVIDSLVGSEGNELEVWDKLKHIDDKEEEEE